MTINDKIKDEKLPYVPKRKATKSQHYCQVTLINMNIFQVNKYCHLIKVEQQKKLSLHILHLVKDFKNKQKQLKNNNNRRKYVKALKVFKPFQDALP